MSRKLISFDWAIKKLLRSKANFGILEGFLSELLFTDVKIIELLESESNREEADDRSNRVDIKVKDSAGQIILIEVQYSREQDYLFRILFSSAKCITEHLDIGMDYDNISKVISVSILYFDFCQGGDYIYHGTTEFVGIHNQTKLELNDAQKNLFNCEKVANIFPEHYIINIKNFDDIAKAPLDEWIYFLKNEEIKDEFHAKGLLEAKEKLDVMKLPPLEQQRYNRHLEVLRRQRSLYKSTYVVGKQEGREAGRKEGLEEGLEEGREEGREEERLVQQQQRQQEKLEQVKVMHESGLRLEQIALFSNMSIEELQSILNKST